jgi:type II restriction enzyme
MSFKVITPQQIQQRASWVDEIASCSSYFGDNTEQLEQKIETEIKRCGIEALLGHLRLCGVIPEKYGHDTSEEKLYSKYTDIVIHQAFLNIGFNSMVLKERGDSADVECSCDKYSFVADAKAFRLSRTAKNQKDFKVQAMDGWKRDKTYAMIVCPVYQFPVRKSQIYQQAITRSVCITTYTHLTVFVRYALLAGQQIAINLIQEVFETIKSLNESKNATVYWESINKNILDCDSRLWDIWREEKIASLESIHLSKIEALDYLFSERTRLMNLSKEEAIKEILKLSKLDNKKKLIESIAERFAKTWRI